MPYNSTYADTDMHRILRTHTHADQRSPIIWDIFKTTYYTPTMTSPVHFEARQKIGIPSSKWQRGGPQMAGSSQKVSAARWDQADRCHRLGDGLQAVSQSTFEGEVCHGRRDRGWSRFLCRNRNIWHDSVRTASQKEVRGRTNLRHC